MKRHLVQPVLAIVALIVSIATATLCVFAWFTTTDNVSGGFNGSVIDPAVNGISVEAYLLDETADNTYTVTNRLGDEKPAAEQTPDSTRYAMRAFGSILTTAILVEVNVSLEHLAAIHLVTQGNDTYQTVIPKSTHNEAYYAPYLSEAVAVYNGVTYDSATKVVTFDQSTATPYYMVNDISTDAVNNSKIEPTIYSGMATELSETFYFVMDYHASLMASIFLRIDDNSSGSSGSLTSTLEFINDITFIAADNA